MKLDKLLTAAALVCSVAAPAFADLPLNVRVSDKAKPGGSVKVLVKTLGNAKCKIEAQDAGFTQTLNLLDKTSNKGGHASWKFDIPKNYKANKMPVTITVDKDGQETKAVKTVDIIK